MSAEAPKLRLNIVLIQDAEDGGYTAFFAEFPDVIAEGDNEADAETNLINTLYAVSQHKLQELRGTFHDNYRTKSLNFELA